MISLLILICVHAVPGTLSQVKPTQNTLAMRLVWYTYIHMYVYNT